MEMLKSGKSGEQRLRLRYLDGLRGLASLYVVMVHLNTYMSRHVGQEPRFVQLIGKFFQYGNFAVDIFIVLSGCVLMIPVTRSQNGYFPGGLWNYIQRRTRRILPPYYAALFFSLLTAVILSVIIHFSNFKWHESREHIEWIKPFFSPIDVITHLLLIHNFNDEISASINAPMWTIAIEWQIYFIFPFLLLPIWRRFGLFSAVITAFLISFLTSLVRFYLWNKLINPVSPWLLGLFALGMVAADIGFSQKPKLVVMRESLPWNIFAIIFFLIALITEPQQIPEWIPDCIFGLTAACVIISCNKLVVQGKKSLILDFFETDWTIALGAFSYSLYLTHAVILTVLGNLLLNLKMSSFEFIGLFYIVGISLSLLIAYLFYLIFERPFISSFLKNSKVKDAVN